MKRAKLQLPPGTDRETAEYIIRSFEELFGRSLDFDVTEDSSLLGGFVAEIDDSIFDSSLSSKLEELRKHMLRG